MIEKIVMPSPLNHPKANRNQTGVTLVEMAIVMVIMGLIVGSGILIGQTMVEGARAKDAMAIATDLATAVYEFKDRYKYFPGDLPDALPSKIPGVSSGCSYNRSSGSTNSGTVGNGLIDYGEANCAIEHLQKAGLIKGSTQPIRSRYGNVRIESRAACEAELSTLLGSAYTFPPNASDTSFNALSQVQHVIILEGLPLSVAREIDRNMDDGDPTTGRHQAFPNAQDPVPLYIIGL